MPFVIAIESDRQQASELAQVVRQRVGAELVLASTLDEALAALRSRVPDVMLIPALMTPKEDSALTEALREVAGPFAVPILITPTLAVTRRSFVSGGGWPWSRKEKSEEDGCDPAVFAEQLTTYLAQSADRPIADDRPDRMPLAAADQQRDAVPPAEPEPEPPSYTEQFNERPAEFGMPESPLFASIDERLARAEDASPIESSEFDHRPVAIAETHDLGIHAPGVGHPTATADEARSNEPSPEQVTRDEPFTIPDKPARHDRPRTGNRAAPPRPRSPRHADKPRARNEDREWDRLIASLREAVEGLTIEAWLTPSRGQKEPARAARDEWGIHDPAQCAMPAVMKRLEELEAGRESGRGGTR